MRLVATGFALALGAALAAPADAQVSLPPLAPGEELLQVGGLGQVTTPATIVMLEAMVVGRGEDPAAAGRMAVAKLARAIAAVRAAGIPAEDVQGGQATSTMMNVPTLLMIRAIASGGQDDSPASVYQPLRIMIRDVSRLEAVQAALRASDAATQTAPEYFLADTTRALREARALAVRRARADAEAQAALRNMRIVRVARVSDRVGGATFSQVANEAEMMTRLFGLFWRNPASSPEVNTFANVAVDFVLAPR